jgi:isopentenyl diphosphate isomerase/L-lactate dehydrogenase-like FMN-dependent dehydrogenase
MALPKIVEAVGGKMKIFVDCGIYSGYDAFKALALGADAVCFGREIVKPLAENGATGVEETLKTATALLTGIMTRTCSPNVGSIDRSVIHRR